MQAAEEAGLSDEALEFDPHASLLVRGSRDPDDVVGVPAGRVDCHRSLTLSGGMRFDDSRLAACAGN